MGKRKEKEELQDFKETVYYDQLKKYLERRLKTIRDLDDEIDLNQHYQLIKANHQGRVQEIKAMQDIICILHEYRDEEVEAENG